MMGKFRIVDTFKVNDGKNLVLAGEIVEGRIQVGTEVYSPENSLAKYSVIGMEFIHGHEEDNAEVGLVLNFEDIVKEQMGKSELWKSKEVLFACED